MTAHGAEPAPHSLWRDTAGHPVELEHRPLPNHADVVIIGAGYTGLWTALHLLRQSPNSNVVVLERTRVGFGASGRNGGWASALFPTALSKIAREAGRDRAIAMQQAMYRAVDDLGSWAAEESIDCDFAQGGTILFSRNAGQVANLRDEVAEHRAWGATDVDWELLDAPTARARINARGIEAGAFTPHCAAIHPLKLVHGLARAVTRRGGIIIEGVTALSYTRGVVSTNHGVITADAIVRATEGFTARFEQHRRAMMPLYSQMLATEPLSEAQWSEIGLHHRETFSENRHVVIYGQRTADGRFAFGGRGSRYQWGSRVHHSMDVNPTTHAYLVRTLTDFFPLLRDVQITHRWGGALGVPRDYFPSVRFADGIGSAGGYVGDGVASSALAGATMADLILGTQSERTALPWVNRTSRQWEPEPLRWIAANAMVTGLQLADREEARTGKPSRLADALYRLL